MKRTYVTLLLVAAFLAGTSAGALLSYRFQRHLMQMADRSLLGLQPQLRGRDVLVVHKSLRSGEVFSLASCTVTNADNWLQSCVEPYLVADVKNLVVVTNVPAGSLLRWSSLKPANQPAPR